MCCINRVLRKICYGEINYFGNLMFSGIEFCSIVVKF